MRVVADVVRLAPVGDERRHEKNDRVEVGRNANRQEQKVNGTVWEQKDGSEDHAANATRRAERAIAVIAAMDDERED